MVKDARLHADELLRVTLASIGDAVITTDAEGRVTYLNAVAESLTGWKIAAAARQPLETVFRIVSENTREPVENPATRALRDGVVVGLANHTLLIAKDGTECPIDDSAAPIRNSEGTLLGVVLVFRDVTAQRQAARRIADSEARKAAILDTALDCIITIDHQGRVLEFNPAAERTFGYRQADAIGREMGELIVPPALRDAHLKGLTRYLATGEAHVLNRRLEITAMRSDGTEFPVELAITRLAVEGPAVFTGHLRDITERKQIEEALKEADRRKDEFLAMLAHELRNPLAVVRNATQIFRLSGTTREAIESASAMMERQVLHLVRLVDDLLDVSRISRGKTELRKEHIQLADVLNQAVEAARPLSQSMGHTLIVTMPPDPIHLNADPTRLAQVVGNLLNNASKYTDHGGRIELTVEQNRHEAIIRVRDTGIGIGKEQLDRIFDLFAQGDSSPQRSQSGLGIGLTLVKQLVEMHGGTVEARSAGLGHGSEFVVRVPILSTASNVKT